MIFKRDPAFWTGLGGTLLAFLGVLFHMTSAQQGWWNGGVAALVGLVVAFTTHDGVMAAVLGFLKAAIMITAGYNVLPFVHNLSDAQQASLFAVLAALVAAFTRTQVTAKVDKWGGPVRAR